MDAKFETFNVDLAAFLVMEGVELIGFEMIDPTRKKVVIKFKDPANKCLDLEQVFLNSDYKKYRDINKFLLRKIHEEIRGGR